MKVSIAAAVVFLITASAVRGDCLPSLAGSVQASFQVESCRMVKAPRPDKRHLVRLSVSRLEVRAVAGAGDSAEFLSYYDGYIANLGKANRLFVDAAGGITCKDFAIGTAHEATIDVVCCDTPPMKGICALPGPLIRPS